MAKLWRQNAIPKTVVFPRMLHHFREQSVVKAFLFFPLILNLLKILHDDDLLQENILIYLLL